MAPPLDHGFHHARFGVIDQCVFQGDAGGDALEIVFTELGNGRDRSLDVQRELDAAIGTVATDLDV